jgi:hypothetical protein
VKNIRNSRKTNHFRRAYFTNAKTPYFSGHPLQNSSRIVISRLIFHFTLRLVRTNPARPASGSDLVPRASCLVPVSFVNDRPIPNSRDWPPYRRHRQYHAHKNCQCTRRALFMSVPRKRLSQITATTYPNGLTDQVLRPALGFQPSINGTFYIWMNALMILQKLQPGRKVFISISSQKRISDLCLKAYQQILVPSNPISQIAQKKTVVVFPI